MEETAFRYSPLTHPRQIRLLRASVDLNVADRIQCEFRVVSLDDLPCQYTAMSYCWGPPTMSYKVWFSG
jgi:hypothetical protein